MKGTVGVAFLGLVLGAAAVLALVWLGASVSRGEHLAAAGLGELFIHRTGHGIGLGLHEPPFVAPGADTVLAEGMTFSVEPGVYTAGSWGARLEDIVAVTADGRRDLNTGERGLRVL